MARSFHLKSAHSTHGLWSRLESIPKICDAIEKDISHRLAELDTQTQAIAGERQSEDRSHLSDSIADEYYTYSTEWTQVIRESFFLALCSSFEFHLTILSDSYAEHIKSAFRTKDVGDRGLRKCETFLKRLGLPKSVFGPDWSSLKEFYKVRNRIAHAGALYNEHTCEFAKRHKEVFEDPIKNGERIKIGNDGVSGLVKVMIRALRNIIGELYKTEPDATATS
jgi:hypothetical protein